MQLHTLVRKHKNETKATRVGRGGKRGTTSGHGTKGQKSRSGHRIRPAIRDLIQRLPKLRGYRNKIKNDVSVIVTLSNLAQLPNPVITIDSLISAGLVEHKNVSVKILATGNLTKALKLEGLKVSAGAKTKIEKAGGSVKSEARSTKSETNPNV
ncbi:MAG: 50S ribosomal protein L15 [bacterium]|nr:50S ribosomal protein L15 [bacterium]